MENLDRDDSHNTFGYDPDFQAWLHDVREQRDAFLSEGIVPPADQPPITPGSAPGEALPEITPTENCYSALLDLNDVQGTGMEGMQFLKGHRFYEAYSAQAAPEDLQTLIQTVLPEQGVDVPDRRVTTGEVVAKVIIQFDTFDTDRAGMQNLDIVNTDNGLAIFKVLSRMEGSEFKRYYTRRLLNREVAALAQDAVAMRDYIVERDAEIAKLGPLVQDPDEHGNRQFHVGDVLSVIMKRSYSARYPEGDADIVRYMTGEAPYGVQIARFMDECAPTLLARHGKLLESYIKQLEEKPLSDELDILKFLGKLTDELDSTFLEVPHLAEEQHARIDVRDELILDYGPAIENKLTSFDLPTDEEPDDRQ